MKHTLFALFFFTSPLWAETLRYSGSTKLDDGQVFRVSVAFETADAYAAPTSATDESVETEFDGIVSEPYVCTRTLRFRGPRISYRVDNGGDLKLKAVNEILEHLVSLARRAESGWNCPKWEEFQGPGWHAQAHAPSLIRAVVGKYRGSDLTLYFPSVMKWESSGRLVGKGKALQLQDIKVTNGSDTKTGWFGYRQDPKVDWETKFGEFRIHREGPVAAR